MIALSKQKSKAPDDQYAKIVDVYTRNKLAFMSRYLEIYYKRTLAGAVLEKADKEKWTRHYRHLEAALDVKGAGTKLAIENAGRPALLRHNQKATTPAASVNRPNRMNAQPEVRKM